MKNKTLYTVVLNDTQKSLIFSILEQYDTVDGFSSFCDGLSNIIKGSVTKQNLLDMCNCVELIDKSLSADLDTILESVADSLYKENVLKS